MGQPVLICDSQAVAHMGAILLYGTRGKLNEFSP